MFFFIDREKKKAREVKGVRQTSTLSYGVHEPSSTYRLPPGSLEPLAGSLRAEPAIPQKMVSQCLCNTFF